MKGILLLLIGFFSFSLQAVTFVEGKHYQRISPEITNHKVIKDFSDEAIKDNKIQVIEFFSYGCSWCFKLDAKIEKWQKSVAQDVRFTRIPVEFQPAWRMLGKAYYVAVASDSFNKIHPALFKAVFNHEIVDSSEESLKKLFVEKGLSAQKFTAHFNSDEIVQKQKWASAISKAYRISAVPAFVVQGKAGTFVTNMQLAGDQESVFKVMDYLVDLQKKG